MNVRDTSESTSVFLVKMTEIYSHKEKCVLNVELVNGKAYKMCRH